MAQPWEVLEVSAEASPEEIRTAYLRLVKQHPPETAPEVFEQIRDAYEQMRDPRARMRQLMFADPTKPMKALLEGKAAARKYAGPKAWLELLKEGGGTR